MRFTPQFLDELRARLPVSEVVGQRVKLKKGRARVAGPVALQQGKDALVLRERPEDGVVRFLVGQERQHLRLRDADRGAVRSPRRSSGWRSSGRHAAAAGVAGRGGARRSSRRRRCVDVVELAAKFFEATLAAAYRRQGARAISLIAGLDPTTQVHVPRWATRRPSGSR